MSTIDRRRSGRPASGGRAYRRPAPGPPPGGPRTRRRGRLPWVGLAAVLVLLWYLPTGLMVVSPGRAIALLERVQVGPTGVRQSAADRIPVGDVLMLTAEARPANIYLAVGALFGLPRGAAVVTKRSVVPPGLTDQQFVAYNDLLMAESVGLASGVAVRGSGGTVTTASGGGVKVVGVPAGAGPTWFRPGDLITAIDGRELDFSGDVAGALSGLEPGTKVQVSVQRDGGRHEVSVNLRPAVPGATELKLGLYLATDRPHVETVPPVTVETGNVGGPSGGLALALAIYARLSADNLLDGRVVAASGQIRLDGTVGPVGGVRQKAVAAQDAGADVFLVHPSNAAEVRASAPGLPVVEVETFEEALAGLRGAR